MVTCAPILDVPETDKSTTLETSPFKSKFPVIVKSSVPDAVTAPNAMVEPVRLTSEPSVVIPL